MRREELIVPCRGRSRDAARAVFNLYLRTVHFDNRH